MKKKRINNPVKKDMYVRELSADHYSWIKRMSKMHGLKVGRVVDIVFDAYKQEIGEELW